MDAITLSPAKPRRRRYSQEFKAGIVQTCRQPGVSVAAIARMHDINDNIVHRWLREAEQLGQGEWAKNPVQTHIELLKPTSSFVPVQVAEPAPSRDVIHLELRRQDMILNVDWPASQASTCMQFLQGLLR